MNFEDMSQDDKDKAVLNFINIKNQLQFEAGGMCLPKFSSLKAMHQFYKIMMEVFTPATGKFKDIEDSGEIPELIFNIPPEYLK